MVLKLLLLTLVFAKTPLAWGFSVERVAHYTAQAREKKLAQEARWLRLGHYHSTWSGGQFSRIRGNFFLDPQGAQNPEKELITTIQTLFSEKTSALQCRYLARTKYLVGQLSILPEDLVTCPERTSWKKKLNAQEIFIVFAANDVNSAASSFGHTFLRLHDPLHHSNLDVLDYGVNFAAQTDDSDGALFALKGLFGVYPGYYSMMPFHQKMKEYTNLEGRDLWEYRLNLSPADVDLIVDHLLELEGSYVPYYFLSENCSYQILELLEVARSDLNLTSQFRDVTIPLDTLKVIGAQKNLLGGERRRPSLKRNFQVNYDRLDSPQKNRIVRLAHQVKQNESVSAEGLDDIAVLDTAMAYFDLQENQGLKNAKDWRYQLALQRSKLGAGPMHPVSDSGVGSPLDSVDPITFEIGYGKRSDQEFAQLKFRRAFHDFLSRDDGVSPFSHLELLSFTLRRPLDKGPVDLEELKILKIVSTLPVSRLERPLSWEIEAGTEIKMNPKLQGGLGYSFDIGPEGRVSQFAVVRAFREEEKNRFGGGAEFLYLQRLRPGLRTLLWGSYLGFGERGPLFEAGVSLAQDLTRHLELRLSYERKREANEALLNLRTTF